MTTSPGPDQPSPVVFVTGANGFVGRRLIRRLVGCDNVRVQALVRTLPVAAHPDVEWVVGDLENPFSYESSLRGVNTVVHLAAAVGRCPATHYFKINRDGTEKLVKACRAAGVARFLFVSTIAVRFSDLETYPYAKSKQAAEALVRSSGMSYQIVRPTIVVGADGPNWASLTRLATLPLTPAFGGGRSFIQPIDVDDVSESLADLVVHPTYEETIELGGPDRLSILEFLRRIHARSSDGRFRIVVVPLAPIRLLLGILESIVGHRLPLTRGQLAVFGNDSTTLPSSYCDRRHARMHTVDQMIERASRPTESTDTNDAHLRREADVFSQYMLSSTPSPRLRRDYTAAHHRGVVDEAQADAWDLRLVKLARRHALICHAVDSFCRFFRPHGLLRRKLVLLLAYWECEPERETSFQIVNPQSAWWIGVRIAGRIAICGLLTAVVAVLTFPLRLLAGRSGGREGSKS